MYRVQSLRCTVQYTGSAMSTNTPGVTWDHVASNHSLQHPWPHPPLASSALGQADQIKYLISIHLNSQAINQIFDWCTEGDRIIWIYYIRQTASVNLKDTARWSSEPEVSRGADGWRVMIIMWVVMTDRYNQTPDLQWQVTCVTRVNVSRTGACTCALHSSVLPWAVSKIIRSEELL